MAEVVLRDADRDRIATVSDDLPASVRVPVFDHWAPCDGLCGRRVCSGHPQFGAADAYDPGGRYELPTLEQVTDVEATDEYPGVSHHECRICRSHVTPRYRADDYRQFMPGLRSSDVLVSRA